MRPNHVVGRNVPPYRVLVPARPSGAGLHRAAHRPPAGGVPVGGARLALSISVLLAIPLLALNLRPAVTSVGAVLADIRAESGMSAVLASIVVAAPVWCFALGGGLAYKLRAAWGTSRTVTLSLVMLAATLATRVVAGPYLLLAGTVVACLAIAVLGTLLPVITHAAPTKAWALLTGCYVAAMGGGSGLGALITPQVSGGWTWQWGVSAWALLAAAALVAWRVAARKFTEPPMAPGPRPSPFTLRPPSTAWSTTLHFGLTSGFTFTIMGWLPSILIDHSHVDSGTVGWMFGVAMALGVPIALMVPKWAKATQSQSALAVVLCVPNMLAIAGLLLYPEITPWVWAIALGLGMPAVGLGLTLISLRAAPDGDTAAALSSMVQGFGYAIAGATALGAGLLHSSTNGWEWPLIALLAILCGQLVTGMHAGLPTTVYSGRRFAPTVHRPEPAPRVPWQGTGPLPMSGAGVGWGPPAAPATAAPVLRPPRPFPSPRPAPEPSTAPVRPVATAPPPDTETIVVPAPVVAAAEPPVEVPLLLVELTESVAAPDVSELADLTAAFTAAETALAAGSPAGHPGGGPTVLADPDPETSLSPSALEVADLTAALAAGSALAAAVATPVAGSGSDVTDLTGDLTADLTAAFTAAESTVPILATLGSAPGVVEPADEVAATPVVAPPVSLAEPSVSLAERVELAAVLGEFVEPAPETISTVIDLGDWGLGTTGDDVTTDDPVLYQYGADPLMTPRQQALFEVAEQEALFEIPLPRVPII